LSAERGRRRGIFQNFYYLLAPPTFHQPNYYSYYQKISRQHQRKMGQKEGKEEVKGENDDNVMNDVEEQQPTKNQPN
jgi:hypothetical protein